MNDCCAAIAGLPFSRMINTTWRTPAASNGGTGLRGCGSGVSVAQLALNPVARSSSVNRTRTPRVVCAMKRSRADVAAAVCAAAFVVVLAVSAYWDRSIRILHIVEALPYIVAAILVLRQHKFGYALGTVSGAFWLFTAAFRTTFVRN